MKKQWVQVIRLAEQAFFTIIFSANKRVGDRGIILPKRFNSKLKIRRFLQKFMTPCLANRVIGNLDLRRINGQLAIPVGDTIGAPPIVKSKVLSSGSRCATLVVWFAFDSSDRFFRVYQLKKLPNGRWIVVGRHPLDYPFNLPQDLLKRQIPCGKICTPWRGKLKTRKKLLSSKKIRY